MGWNVSAYCQTGNSWRNTSGSAGETYLVSWGGPADNCQSFCDNVYITGLNVTYGTGYPDDGYPMNSTTTGGWSSGGAHNSNITLGDVIAPTITIISPTSLYYYTTSSVWFNVTSNEVSPWCGYSLDSTANVTLTNSSGTWHNLNTSVLEGTHSVRFYCNDSAGNMGIAGPRTFYVDTISPLATFGTNPINYYNSTSENIVFDGKCSDNVGLSSLQIWTNRTGWAMNAVQSNPTNNSFSNLSVLGFPDGAYKWAVYCLDNAGWTDFTDTNRTFYIDTSGPDNPPVASTNNPTNGSTWTSSQTVTFNLKCVDDNGVSHLRLYGNWSGNWTLEQDNPSPGNNVWWNPTATIANGVYLWAAWCNDSIGQTNMTQNITFTVNYVAPPPGGGGGGGTTVCADTCYLGTTCPSGSSSVFGSCPTSQTCCTASYCPYAKTFITQYSMLGFSAFDFDTFCTLNPTVNKTKLADTVNNYVTQCGSHAGLHGSTD